jgi:hypothetical protein
MGSNDRKLLPYEHQLIDSLGITKEEYLNFVAQQQIYSDPKEGTILDVRNAPGVAIFLTIIGTILQVIGSFLLEPEGQRPENRDTVFAPRSGFNSIQELGKYGDPINLIYTNTDVNSSGGVRASTSLIWSAVKSYGSSQYVQLLLLLGAGGIGRVDFGRTAFGQTPIRDLVAQNYWIYFKENATGFLFGRDLKLGGNGERDPIEVNAGTGSLYRVSPANTTSNGDGFSNALSPSASNSFGVYGPVPLNVNVLIRNADGNFQRTANEITVQLAGWGESSAASINTRINVGQQLVVTLAGTGTVANSVVKEEAADQRRALSSVFDNAGMFKLGSAKFSVLSSSRGSTDEGPMVVTLQCVESGLSPSTIYGRKNSTGSAQAVANLDPDYISLRDGAKILIQEDERTTTSTLTGVIQAAGIETPVGEFDKPEVLAADGRIFIREFYKASGLVSTPKGLSVSTVTKVRFVFKRDLTDVEKGILQDFAAVQRTINIDDSGDDTFFNKALVKIETASYETISPCNRVDLAIKAKVFRRISGRQEKYGAEERPGYPVSDNGIKLRSALFLFKYKTTSDATYQYVKGIFVVRRASDVDNFISLRFNSGEFGVATARHWQFELEPIHDTMAEIKDKNLQVNGRTSFFYLENSGMPVSLEIGNNRKLVFVGFIEATPSMFPPRNKTPKDTNEWDLFSNTADTQLQISFDNGPEFSLTAVTEQVVEPFSNFPQLYEDLSLVGFNLYSGRNVQDLRSLSMFVTRGRYSRLLRTSGIVNGISWGQPGFEYLSSAANGYANTAPDIFIDTIIDRNDGIGKYAGDLFSVDIEQLARSKKFCEVNNLFMDGVIAEPTSWRQFWANNATFSLLELTTRDGKETLIPGLPYDPATGQITRNITVTALFNQGNILEDSYKEEFIDYGTSTEDVIVTAIYRDNERNGSFPRNNSVDVQLADVDENSAIRETIDFSQFVTRRSQAILLGKFLCQTRRHSRRAIEFKTFPTDSFVTPGGFIYVELAQNQWNNIESGSIGLDGELNLPLAKQVANGTYQVLMYNPNEPSTGTIFRGSVSVVANKASSLASFQKYIFVLGVAIRTKRIFRVTEVAMDEEGEVTIRAIEHPTGEGQQSLITNGLSTIVPGLFAIDGRPE